MASSKNLIVLALFGLLAISAVSAQSTGGAADQLVNALKSLLTSIINIVKQLLDQLLPTLNGILKDVSIQSYHKYNILGTCQRPTTPPERHHQLAKHPRSSSPRPS